MSATRLAACSGPQVHTLPSGPVSSTLTGSCGTSRPFAAKLNPFGSGLVYSSWVAYVYGTGIPRAIALDASGAAYIVGFTDASYFPSTPGAFQETFQGRAQFVHVALPPVDSRKQL